MLLHRVDQAQQEHHALLEAMKAMDVERLEEMVRQHNRGALASYTSYLENTATATSA